MSGIIRSYGEDLLEKSDRWLSTADSGIKAFDIVNSATYIASRCEVFNLNPDSAHKIQKIAAKTLLDELDLEHVAPRLK